MLSKEEISIRTLIEDLEKTAHSLNLDKEFDLVIKLAKQKARENKGNMDANL